MTLSYGLLGLINSCPLSGYDLKKLFEESVNYFWSARTSQIYRELKTLEQAGSVVSSLEKSHSGPHRRIYRITEAGRERLKVWLLDDTREIEKNNRNEFLLRIFLSSSVGGDNLLVLLRRRLEKYRRDLERLDASASTIPDYRERFDIEKERLFWQIALMRGYHDVRSHIQWAEESIRLLEAQGFSAP